MAGSKLAVLAVLFSAGVMLTAGDVLMKQWVEEHRALWYACGLGLYLVGLVGLSFTYRYQNIAVASVIMEVFNILLLTAVSWLWFHEPVSAKQAAGIGAGILAVFLLA